MAKRLSLIIGNSVFRDQTLARLLKPDADVGALADVLRGKLMGAELLVNFKKLELPRLAGSGFRCYRAAGTSYCRNSATR